MGSFMSRQNAAIEEADQSQSHAYKYPPRVGNFFGSHFIMGGERFDTPQPESYLFGENADLNFLGNRPTAFPYPPPQANGPTKTLKSLVNIRKESVRFVRVPNEKKLSNSSGVSDGVEDLDGNVLCGMEYIAAATLPCSYNIEFTFDTDVKCAITIYYCCTEEVSPSGVTLLPPDGLTSETYHYEKGINQYFSQPSHVFNPQLIPEDDLVYNPAKEQYPVAIHCVVEEGNEECRQSHTTICVIDHHPESNSYVLRALKQKIFVDGLCYLLQEIYGIENKAVNKSSIDEDTDDHGSECVICMSETRDTLILPCRHLCLCHSCADSLRYQANNCPICRAPFRALLQIRAIQKHVSHGLHQATPATGVGSGNTAAVASATATAAGTGASTAASGGSGAGSGSAGTGSGSAAGVGGSEPAQRDVPPLYRPVSLIEALNGPPQYIGRVRASESDVTDAVGSVTSTGDNNKATSPVKPNSQRRGKGKKNVSTCTSTNELGTATNTTGCNTSTGNNSSTLSVVDIESDPKKSSTTSLYASPVKHKSTSTAGSTTTAGQDKLQIVNERHSLKLPKQKRHSSASSSSVGGNSGGGGGSSSNNTSGECGMITTTIAAAVHEDVMDDDDDSENEKLSPLLSPGGSAGKCNKTTPTQTNKTTLKQVVAHMGGNDDDDDCADIDEHDPEQDNDGGNNSIGGGSVASGSIGGGGDVGETKTKSFSLKKQKRPELTSSGTTHTHTVAIQANADAQALATNLNAEDSDYYTPEDTQNSILSPLCPPAERTKSGELLANSSSSSSKLNVVGTAGSGVTGVGSASASASASVSASGSVVVSFSSLKKNLHKKSTSVGNIVGPNASGSSCHNIGGTTSDLKCNNVSSLPDMLDSPISANSASTRSSSDSYSSSSSTKQLLSSNPSTTATASAANIIVDDKTALQNAVNV